MFILRYVCLDEGVHSHLNHTLGETFCIHYFGSPMYNLIMDRNAISKDSRNIIHAVVTKGEDDQDTYLPIAVGDECYIMTDTGNTFEKI